MNSPCLNNKISLPPLLLDAVTWLVSGPLPLPHIPAATYWAHWAPGHHGPWWIQLNTNTSPITADCFAAELHTLSLQVNTNNTHHVRTLQGVRERARVSQLVILSRWWAHLQCFAGCTDHTHGTTAGYCVAGKCAQYRNIRPFKRNWGLKYSCILPNSLEHWPSAQQTITQTGMEHFPFYYHATLIPSAQWTLPAEESQIW